MQGWWIIRPLPPHLGQGEEVANTPMGVCRRTWTVPVPWQSGHTSGDVPGAQPLPWQVSQVSYRSTVTAFSQPKAASSKLMAMDMRLLSPRWGALGLVRRPPPKPPPKKLPKMSPRSPKSKLPSNPPPKPPAPKLGSPPAWPYWSYRAFLSASERTS